jgi:response regulator of citrate/malate metabolism
MDKQILTGPNYHKIFQDIIAYDFPDVKKECKSILAKAKLTSSDIIALNKKIFKTQSNEKSENPKFRSYDRNTIAMVLEYQRKNMLNDTQLAEHFSISRNTIRKWRNNFLFV